MYGGGVLEELRKRLDRARLYARALRASNVIQPVRPGQIIEFVRGVPFITILFMANNLLPLFLPATWAPDRFLRPLRSSYTPRHAALRPSVSEERGRARAGDADGR